MIPFVSTHEHEPDGAFDVAVDAWPGYERKWYHDMAALRAGGRPFDPRWIVASDPIGTDDAPPAMVGIAVLWNSLASYDVCELDWVSVRRDRQGQGIGRLILAEAVRVAAARQPCLTFTTSSPDFYARVLPPGSWTRIAYSGDARTLFVVRHEFAHR